MKKIYRLFTILTVIFLIQIACENKFTFNVDCDECQQRQPETGSMEIKLTINDENSVVPVKIFLDNIENTAGHLLDTNVSKGTIYINNIPLDKTYAVQASYKEGGKTIVAVDGGKFKTKLISEYCDVDCYIIEGGEYDLRLK